MRRNDDVDLLGKDVQPSQRIEQVAVAKTPQTPRADASIEQDRLALALHHETQHARSHLRSRILPTNVLCELLEWNLVGRTIAQMRRRRRRPVTVARNRDVHRSNANGFLHQVNSYPSTG